MRKEAVARRGPRLSRKLWRTARLSQQTQRRHHRLVPRLRRIASRRTGCANAAH